MRFRPDIDGLRAIAVLAVIGYHAGVIPGGLVGVDVFLVISGYLITGLLAEERERGGRIDLVGFYARRVRRILPAMITVVGVVLVVAPALLPALAQRHAAQSALAALSFTANVFFQRTTGGYFDPNVEQVPLLHLWSLSVEEQFYLVWPLLLFLVRRRGPLLAVALASFALCEFWIRSGSDAAFFQTAARVWELAAGGLLALSPSIRGGRTASVAGIALVVGGCAVSWNHFPGLGATPAVAGTLMLLASAAGPGGALLATRPMRWVGERSYSLYLWHWPFLALQAVLTPGLPSIPARLAACAASAVVACAAYRYIENPLRRTRASHRRTIAAGMAASAAVAVIALLQLRGIDVEPADVAAVDYPDRTCHYRATDTVFPKCPLPARDIAIWGDSMAYAWSAAVPQAVRLTRDACRPMSRPANGTRGADDACARFNAFALQHAASMHTVVLAGRWLQEPTVPGLDATLDALSRVQRVVIIGPSPQLRDEAPKCVRLRRENDCAIPRAQFDAQATPVLAELRRLAARHPNVRVVDVTPVFCDDRQCTVARDGVVLYWDTHHVSSTAARRAARTFGPLDDALH